VTVYNGVYSNLIGEDRTDALAAIHDDVKFDKWMEKYEKERANRATTPAGKGQGKKKVLDKEAYLAARTHGGK
jgi:hypothetical protein